MLSSAGNEREKYVRTSLCFVFDNVWILFLDRKTKKIKICIFLGGNNHGSNRTSKMV